MVALSTGGGSVLSPRGYWGLQECEGRWNFRLKDVSRLSMDGLKAREARQPETGAGLPQQNCRGGACGQRRTTQNL